MKLHSLLDKLRSSEDSLPGDSAHRMIIPINRPLSSQIPDISSYRDSAVAIYLFETNGFAQTILIERPEYEGHHSKQIGFPGGKLEDLDPNLEYTALREGYEEIGVPQSNCELILPLSKVHIPVSKFTIHPFVFHLDELPELRLDQREVARVITFPLIQLLDDQRIVRRNIRIGSGLTQKDIPGFQVNDNEFVWGATAMILSEIRHIALQIG